MPETLTGEHSDDYGSGLTQQTGAIEDQLMEKPATTLIGVFAQLSVMREWADTGGDVAGGAAKIKTFQDRVDSTLRDAAAARGFEVPAYVGIEDFPISSA